MCPDCVRKLGAEEIKKIFAFAIAIDICNVHSTTHITFPDWISGVLLSFYLAIVQYDIGFEAERPITALNISFS